MGWVEESFLLHFSLAHLSPTLVDATCNLMPSRISTLFLRHIFSLPAPHSDSQSQPYRTCLRISTTLISSFPPRKPPGGDVPTALSLLRALRRHGQDEGFGSVGPGTHPPNWGLGIHVKKLGERHSYTPRNFVMGSIRCECWPPFFPKHCCTGEFDAFHGDRVGSAKIIPVVAPQS